jgi:hypothetical protein
VNRAVGKKPVKSKSLSALAAGISARARDAATRASKILPADPLVAALARKGEVSSAREKVVTGLMARGVSSAPIQVVKSAPVRIVTPVARKSAPGRPAVTPAPGKSAPGRPQIRAVMPVARKSAPGRPQIRTVTPVASKSAPRRPQIRAVTPVATKSAPRRPDIRAVAPVARKSAPRRPEIRTVTPVARKSAPRRPEVRPLTSPAGNGFSAPRKSIGYVPKTVHERAAETAGRVVPRVNPRPSISKVTHTVRPVPSSQPGPTSGIPPGVAGTSRSAASVASLVKTAEGSRAAPGKSRQSAQSQAESRRQYPRADLTVQAKLSLADKPTHSFEAALPTSNLSVGGMFLASTFFLKMGTRLQVRLSLPPHGREVHVKAEVVRVESQGKHSGFALRFTDYLDGSEVVLATHFLSPVLREFIGHYASGNGFKPTPEYLAHTADVLAAWELRRAQLGGDIWVVPGDQA